ncbi:hypothetical protein R50072_01610 [Simiduia litorea]
MPSLMAFKFAQIVICTRSSHPCARGIPFILNIAAPALPCARGIPFILNIKKPRIGGVKNSITSIEESKGEHYITWY